MTKYKEIYGVDISKDAFDVFGSLKGHLVYKNRQEGFKSFACFYINANVGSTFSGTSCFTFVLGSILPSYFKYQSRFFPAICNSLFGI